MVVGVGVLGGEWKWMELSGEALGWVGLGWCVSAFFLVSEVIDAMRCDAALLMDGQQRGKEAYPSRCIFVPSTLP
jgi:hypothetical protein